MTTSARIRPVAVVIGAAAPSVLRMTARFLGAQPDILVAGLASTASGAVDLAVELRPEVVVLCEGLAREFAASYAARAGGAVPPPVVALTDDGPPVRDGQFVKTRHLGADLVPAIQRIARPVLNGPR